MKKDFEIEELEAVGSNKNNLADNTEDEFSYYDCPFCDSINTKKIDYDEYVCLNCGESFAPYF